MQIRALSIAALLGIAVCLLPVSGWTAGAQDPTEEEGGRHPGPAYDDSNSQPLAIRLSADKLYVGESVLLTVSGGVEPYRIISYEQKIRVVPQSRNNYQVIGLTAGASVVIIGDSKENSISQEITVYEKPYYQSPEKA